MPNDKPAKRLLEEARELGLPKHSGPPDTAAVTRQDGEARWIDARSTTPQNVPGDFGGDDISRTMDQLAARKAAPVEEEEYTGPEDEDDISRTMAQLRVGAARKAMETHGMDPRQGRTIPDIPRKYDPRSAENMARQAPPAGDLVGRKK